MNQDSLHQCIQYISMYSSLPVCYFSWFPAWFVCCWTQWGGSVFELKPDRPWHLPASLCHSGLPLPKEEEEGYLAPFQLYLFNHIVPPIQSPVFSGLWPHYVFFFMTDRDITLCSPPGGVLKRSHHVFRRWFCSCLTSKMPRWLPKSDRKPLIKEETVNITTDWPVDSKPHTRQHSRTVMQLAFLVWTQIDHFIHKMRAIKADLGERAVAGCPCVHIQLEAETWKPWLLSKEVEEVVENESGRQQGFNN